MITELISLILENKVEGGGKTTYPICINIPYIWAIIYNAVESFITGTKLEIVLLSANTNFTEYFFHIGETSLNQFCNTPKAYKL